jgi:8-oxo-dGTP diphosphatase
MQYPAVGVGIIIHWQEQILLIRRVNAHGSGTWSTPGGHLEYGETPEACAAREAFEETGVVVGGIHFKTLTNDVFVSEGRHYITIWMEGQYLNGEPVINQNELTELGWFTWDALPVPLFLPLQNLLDGKHYSPPG